MRPQKDIFTPFVNMIRVVELFAGVGSQHMALKNLKIDFKIVAISEIDKFAIQSYTAIHGSVKNLGDITLINPADMPDHDLMTYSFPCQDISVAGKQNGLDEDSETRSSLLWQCKKIIEAKNPKYLLLENVKNLVGKKHKHNFDKWLRWLEAQGYTNYWQVLNAKDYGVPQNRERVFVVSILDDTEGYDFPEPVELDKRLKDVLEDEVDEKYYLKKEIQERFQFSLNLKNEIKTVGSTNPTKKIQQRCVVYSDEGISGSLTATDYKQPKQILQVGNIRGWKHEEMSRVYSKNGLSPTLSTMQGGNRQPKVLIKNATKKGYLEAVDGDGTDLNYPDSETRRGRVQKQVSHTLTTNDSLGVLELPAIVASRGRNPENPSDRTVGAPTEQRLEINKKGISNTLTTVQKDNYVLEPEYRIRKLTPLECWRLMGFSDEDFYKAEAVCSNSQLYKQAGNSIVVNVLEGIFKNLFMPDEKPEIFQQMTLL